MPEQPKDDGSRQGSPGPADLENEDGEVRSSGSGQVTEGEVRQAAAVVATSSLAGHNATLDLYLQTDVGRQFVEVESKERQRAVEDEVKRIQDQQKRSDAAMQEYQRRVAAEAEQTRAVRDASQEAAEQEAEDGKPKSTSDRTPTSAAKVEGSTKKSAAR